MSREKRTKRAKISPAGRGLALLLSAAMAVNGAPLSSLVFAEEYASAETYEEADTEASVSEVEESAEPAAEMSAGDVVSEHTDVDTAETTVEPAVDEETPDEELAVDEETSDAFSDEQPDDELIEEELIEEGFTEADEELAGDIADILVLEEDIEQSSAADMELLFDRQQVEGTDMKISAEAPAGAFPDGVLLSAALMDTPDSIAEEIASLADEAVYTIEADDLLSFDVHFYLPEDPDTEIEPLLPISITFEGLDDLLGVENEDIQLFHTHEGKPTVQVDTVAVTEGALVIPEMEEFSVLTAGRSNAPMKAPADDAASVLTVVSSSLDALPKDEDGIIRYNLIDNAVNTFDLTIPKSAFTGSNLTLKITMPNYGMAFADNVVNDFTEQRQILSAAFTKDANGYNTTLTLTIDGNLTEQYMTSFGTKYVPLSSAQAADVIASGFQSSAVTFTLTNAEGDVIAENDAYKLYPEEGTLDESMLAVDDHAAYTTTIPYYADINDYYSQYSAGRANLYNNDYLIITVPTFGYEDTPLYQIDAIRVYKPDEKLYLQRIWYNNQGDYTFLKPHNSILNYFTIESENGTYKVYEDSDNKEYYRLIPNKNFYNTGTISQTGDISYAAILNWNIESDQELEENKTYPDPGIVFEYTTAGDQKNEITKTGFVITTLPINHVDYLTYSYNGAYAVDNKKAVVPGASYEREYMVSMKNQSNQNWSNADNPVENRSVKGEVTEEYTFPKEIQPTVWEAEQYACSQRTKVNDIVITIVDDQGQQVGDPVTVPVEKIAKNNRNTGENTCKVDLAAYLEEGQRVSKVVVHWNDIWQPWWARSEFGYTIPENIDAGVEEAVVHYEAAGVDSTKTVSRDFYYRIGQKKCPVVYMEPNRGDQPCFPLDLNGKTEAVISNAVALAGEWGGSYKTSLEDPVFKLYTTLSYTEGCEDANNFLSGNMTLTPNLSSWKIEYSYFDTETAAVRNGEFTIGELTGDYQLTREALGLSEDDFIVGPMVFSYDGHFEFREMEKKPYWIQDSSTKYYDYTYLVKNVRVKAIDYDMYGNRVKTQIYVSGNEGTGSTVNLNATIEHSEACDREKHTSGGEAAFTTLKGCRIGIQSNYSYIVTDSVTKDESITGTVKDRTVLQGGTFESQVDVSLNMKNEKFDYGITAYTGGSPRNNYIPYDVPESIYIELTDSKFSVDKRNTDFVNSLAGHGMTTDDVSMVTTADGRRFIKLSTGDRPSAWLRRFIHQGKGDQTMSFIIPLKVWSGTEVGTYNPFGEVYYDISQLPVKYNDLTEDTNYNKVVFVNAVPDELGLLEDGDTTTERLWKGNLSGMTVEVTRNTVTGVTQIPGLNEVYSDTEELEFMPHERDQLFSSITITAPLTTAYNYTTINKLPRKGETITYHYRQGGQLIAGQAESTYDLYLTGPAFLRNTSAPDTSTITLSYSTDGADYVTADAVSDWAEVRYIKTVVDVISDRRSTEVWLPLVAEDKTEVGLGDLTNYVTADAYYSEAVDGTPVTVLAESAVFTYMDYLINGTAWLDVNENGIFDQGESKQSGITFTLKTAEDKAVDTAVSDADGNFTLRTPNNRANQIVEVTLPDDTVLTRTSSLAVSSETAPESNFDRNTGKAVLPELEKREYGLLGAGLVHLPVITAEDVILHVSAEQTDDNGANAVCTSDNPDNQNPQIRYEAVEDSAIANVTADGRITPAATGKESGLKVSAQNTLGDTVTALYHVIVYANVKYDRNSNESAQVTGEVPTDVNQYYPDSLVQDKDLVTVADEGSLARTGYRVIGWSTVKIDTPDGVQHSHGDAEYYDFEDTFHTGSVSEDITLYAVWSANAYQVVFHKNAESAEGVMQNQIFVYDAAQKLNANQFTRTGYDFIGWSSSAESTDITYADEVEVKNLTPEPDGIVDLYAVWKPHTYTVVFDKNAETAKRTMEDEAFTYDEEKTLYKNSFINPGYDFIGWAETSDGAVQYSDEQAVKNLTDVDEAVVTLYAVWQLRPIPTVDRTVEKVWDDKLNQDGIRPDSVVIYLHRTENGSEENTVIDTVALSAANGWQYSWKDLPEHYFNDEDEQVDYAYSVTEKAVPKYETIISDVDENGVWTVTNTYIPETTSLTVKKIWDDNNNQDNLRPEAITVHILSNGILRENTEEVQYTAEITAAGNNGEVKASESGSNEWTYTFENLPVYDRGHRINYSVTEAAVDGYSASINGHTITNSYTPGKTSVTVTKAWDDNNNQDGVRPDTVTVLLLADGVVTDKQILRAESGWTYTWKDLDLKKNGKDIIYTTTEDEEALPADDGKAYTLKDISEISARNFVITNTHATAVREIVVTKNWVDESNAKSRRPDAITIRLMANGAEVQSQTVDVVKDSNAQRITFASLPVYANGKEIVYTVSEDAVQNYEAVISGYTITNTYKSKTDGSSNSGGSDSGSNDKPGDSDKKSGGTSGSGRSSTGGSASGSGTGSSSGNSSPKTGDGTPVMQWAVLLLLAVLISGGCSLYLRKKRERAV